jgi:hypothetical protein
MISMLARKVECVGALAAARPAGNQRQLRHLFEA